MEKSVTGLLDEVLHFLSTMQGVCGTNCGSIGPKINAFCERLVACDT